MTIYVLVGIAYFYGMPVETLLGGYQTFPACDQAAIALRPKHPAIKIECRELDVQLGY